MMPLQLEFKKEKYRVEENKETKRSKRLGLKAAFINSKYGGH